MVGSPHHKELCTKGLQHWGYALPIIEILRVLLQFVLKVQMVQIIGLLEILNIISVYIIIIFVVLNNCIFTVFFLLFEVDILKYTILN